MSRLRSRVGDLLGRHPWMVGWVLGAFFFLAEAGSYLLGVLACTILVKRGGPEYLPYTYMALNVMFIPILLASLLRPPASSYKAVSTSFVAYLLGLGLVLPAADSSSPWILALIYVIARLGKLFWSTFAVGMVTEVLPLREAKALTPRLLACGAAGIVAGGLVLKPALALIGTTRTFLILWTLVLVAFGILHVIGWSLPGTGSTRVDGRADVAPEHQEREGVWTTIARTLARLMADPLTRIIGLMNLFVVGIRYLLEYVYAAQMAAHFPTEEAMASFAGSFEATLQVSTIFVQLALVAPMMRRIRVGGMAMVLPAILTVMCLLGGLTGSFHAVMACQFLYWIGADGFSRPTRQVLIGAVPRDRSHHVPVLMATLGMTGSLGASLVLVPIAAIDRVSVTLAFIGLVSLLFLVVAARAGRIYSESLSRTLEELDSAGRVEILSALGSDERSPGVGAVEALLDSVDPEVRLDAVGHAANLGPAVEGVLLSRVLSESDPKVRTAMVAVLADLKSPDLLPIVQRWGKDPDPRVRANALEALVAFPADPASRESLLAGLQASAPRVRGAAVITIIRTWEEHGMLEAALDALAAMADPTAPPAERATAAAVMGRLGYLLFLEDLEGFLSDPVPAVRSAAVQALERMQTTRAREALQDALEKETDGAVRERMEATIERLRDETVLSIMDVVDTLSPEERARIVETLTRSDSDARMELLRDAVAISHPRMRRELIRLAQTSRDSGLIEAVRRCVRRSGNESWVDLRPLLEYLGQGGQEDQPDLSPHYGIVQRLLADSTLDDLTRHVLEALSRLWTYIAVAEALAGSEEPGRVEARRRAMARQDRLLEHIFTVTGLATPVPERAVRLMRGAMSSDRYVSSLNLELLEGWLPDRVREPMVGLLEAFPDRGKRRERAFAESGLEATLDPALIDLDAPPIQGDGSHS